MPRIHELPDWAALKWDDEYAKLAKCSEDTALRDIKHLVEREILVQEDGGGRNTSYRLADAAERG